MPTQTEIRPPAVVTADNTAMIAVYATHDAAEKAIKELQQSGFDMHKLSIVRERITTRKKTSSAITQPASA